jgi:hypothetical protein
VERHPPCGGELLAFFEALPLRCVSLCLLAVHNNRPDITAFSPPPCFACFWLQIIDSIPKDTKGKVLLVLNLAR